MAQHRPHQLEELVDVLSRVSQEMRGDGWGRGDACESLGPDVHPYDLSAGGAGYNQDFPQVRAAAFPGPDVDSLL